MIINQEEKKIIRSSDFESQEFKVDVSVLSILRNSLYSKKAEAACREISCNGLDAHIDAGKADIPIEVTLPSLFEPTFKVRDYGKSMSDEIVHDIYSYYGKSTKRDSNKAIGAFGIGKLSPLCISPAFQLTCIQNNYKRIYTIYVNEQNIDQIDLIFEGETDEKTGTEVSFGVKPTEIYSFQEACQKIFRFWKTSPIILNYPSYKKMEVEYYLLKSDRWGFMKTGSSCLVSGPIAYNLDENQIPELSEIQRSILGKNLAIFTEIGDVHLQASRESISYTPKTIKFLQQKIAEIESEIISEVHNKLNALKTELDGRRFFYNILTDLGNLSVISELVKNKIKIVVNNEHIFEDFFRVTNKDMPLLMGCYERSNSSGKYHFKVKDSSIFRYLNAETPLNGCFRLFYDLNKLKKGKIKRLCQHYTDGKYFQIGNEIYVFQPNTLKELEDYCIAKGIDFTQFKDINTTVILPKKVKSPDGQNKNTFNCKIYDPQQLFEGDTSNIEKNINLYNADVDFEEVKLGYYLFSHYGKFYYHDNRIQEVGIHIEHLYDFLLNNDNDFAVEPIIYIIPLKNIEKISNNFKKIGDVVPEILKDHSRLDASIKTNINKVDYSSQIKYLKKFIESGQYQITPQLSEIIELLDFRDMVEEKYLHIKKEFGIICSFIANATNNKVNFINKKINAYFNQYPLICHINCYEFQRDKTIKDIIYYMNLIDTEFSKKELEVEVEIA
jgi:hypothetical protein